MRTLTIAIILLSCCFCTDAQVFNSNQAKLVVKTGAGEGPAWHPQYGLFTSGDGDINLLDRDGRRSTFMADAGTNGLLFDHQGRLLICQPKTRRVSRVNVATREIEVLTDKFDGKRYNQPNDITVDSKGRIYFSDPRYGSRDDMEQVDDDGRKIEGVYRIDLDGTVARIVTHEVDRPNGVLVTPDDKFLFVAGNNNNTAGGARKLWRFALKANGDVDLRTQTLLLDWKTGRGPDGMVLDERGYLYVAGGLNKANPPHETADEFLGGVYVFTPRGKFIEFVGVPHDEVTNCTFGGADLSTLFITAGGSLWSIRTTSTGALPWKGATP